MSEVPATLKEGRYVVGEPLGDGGMASVYRCYDELLDVERAIKVLKSERSTDTKSRARFVNEARLMSQLRHPGVVSVFDVVEDQGTVFMVMDVVEGGNLAIRVNKYGPMPAKMAVDAMLVVVDALVAAHAAGIVHRDVKPHNILLTAAGEPRLTDFGIARLVHEEDVFTRPGSAVGTWAYMAPEQRSAGGVMDGRADIYGCGATLFALVSGTEPVDIFAADSDSDRYAPIPEVLRSVLVRSTQYSADDRYPDMESFKVALQAIRTQLPVVPTNTPPLPGVLLLQHDANGNTEESVDDAGGRFEAGEALDRHGVHRSGIGSISVAKRVFFVGGIGIALGLIITVSLALLFTYFAFFENDESVANTDASSPVVERSVPSLSTTETDFVPLGDKDSTDVEFAAPVVVPAESIEPQSVVVEEAVAPTPAAVPTTFGALVVTTIPSSALYIDGVNHGQTRFSGDIAIGKRQIRVVSPQGSAYTFDVNVIEHETISFCYDFELESECL